MECTFESREMRQTYCEELIRLAERDERIVLVGADLMRADGTLPFKDRFPDRSFDVGVAESNMMGVAAGLATRGKAPFATTFAAFASRRCCDQIAVSVAYPRLNVKIAGIDPGISTEQNGGSHMAIEDMALMRAIPGMLVVEPVDSVQLAQALPQIIDYDGPCYLRLHRKRAPKVFDDAYHFSLGKADVLRAGTGVAIFTSGLMLYKSLVAAAELAVKGVDAAVVNVHTVKPVDANLVVAVARKCGAAVTAENGTFLGGLGGAVCEVLSSSAPAPVKRVRVADRFGEVGSMAYLHEKLGIDVKDVIAAAEAAVSMKKKCNA